MGWKLGFIAVVFALSAGPMAAEAWAFSPSPEPSVDAGVQWVAGGCGLGMHRGPYGGCRANAGYPAVGYPAVGVYRGGTYYRGGVYRGGVYRGGVYRGGGYRRGVYRR